MYIGLGLFLIVVGAILKFAVTGSVSGIDIQSVGVICMVVGVVAIVISFVLRRPSAVRASRVTQTDPATGTHVEETRLDRGQD
ncbi:MAG: DUF6458 family protein [Nostocoides sp.]